MKYRRRLSLGASSAYSLLRVTALNFKRNEVMKYCASLSFYTMFSIAPLLIVAIALGSAIFGRHAINGHLFGRIHGLVGTDAAIAIQGMLGHTSLRKDNLFHTVLGIVIFFVGATRVFAEIQSTLNRIWGLKARPDRGVVRYLVSRLWTFVMVITVAFLSVFSFVASTAVDLLGNRLSSVLADTSVILFLVNHVVTYSIFVLLFILIFKYLPDCIVAWKDALVGSLFTAALLLLGKYLFTIYLNFTGMAGVYGAAGSLVIVLLYIFFSSVILYFGAEFTLVYAVNHGHGIKPNSFSLKVRYVEEEIALDNKRSSSAGSSPQEAG